VRKRGHPSFLLPLIDEKTIRELIESELEGSSYFVVDVSVKPGNRIEVSLDGDEGLPIKKCVEVSRFVEKEFDREEHDYSLQVMSAGLGYPLKLHRQFVKNAGRDVKYVLTDGRAGEAKMKEVDEKGILLWNQKKVKVEGKKKKILVEEEQRIEYSELKEVRVKLSF